MSQQSHFDGIWRQRIEAGNDSGLRGNRRALKALTLLSPGSRLLDVGCGTGSLGEAASGRFGEVHGVDISPHAVAVAQQRGVQAQVLDAGVTAFPYPDGLFDAVVAMSVLQYVVDVENTLRECRRVLRPDGQCITAVPNMRAAWRLWRLAIQGTVPRTSHDAVGLDGGAVHYFTTRTARRLFARAGLHVDRTYGIFCVPRWLEDRVDSGPLASLKREFLSAEILFDMRAGQPGEND